MYKIKYIFLFLFLLAIPLTAQNKLSDKATISLLTMSPYNGEVFTLYGHTALRINDPIQEEDLIFNYGVFSFDQPNFIYRFAKGETDYQLGIEKSKGYIAGYLMRGSEVTEQILNLNQEEKNKIWNFLLNNYQPQNREYRYNYFFDNCSTRPRDIIEQCVNGKVSYAPKETQQTFRELIDDCTRSQPWFTFACGLALGAPTDEAATAHEELFLPLYLKEALDKASIVSANGEKRKLVLSSSSFVPDEDIEIQTSGLFTPLLCGWLLFCLITILTYSEWQRKTLFRSIDIILFTIAGLAGCVLFFLNFFSEHPCTSPNWSLIWLNPLQLIAVILFIVKKYKKGAYCYHFINFAALTLLLLGWKWIPQQFNPAFIPFILTLWMRSGYSVYRYIMNK